MREKKKCTQCKRTILLKNFKKDPRRKDGRICDVCIKCQKKKRGCKSKKPRWEKYQEKMPKREKGGKLYNHPKSLIMKFLRRGGFKRRMDEYQDKIISYDDSPTGRAYIGINKKPLMKNEDGHGFQGVLLQDELRELVQCAACGKWMQKISHTHLKKCCGLTVDEYKEKYGLCKSTGLVSDETSFRLTQACLKNKEGIERFTKKYAGRKPPNTEGRKKTRQEENRYGTCPEQIKTRLYEFIINNRELPSQGNRGRPVYKVIARKSGKKFGEALADYGLPKFWRCGSNFEYTFPDGSKYFYNINQFHDREALYNLIMQKCPAIKEHLNQ